MVILTEDENIYEFDFLGDCYISAQGSGTIEIQRKMGGEFVTLTNQEGVPMQFAETGLIFNSFINCKKRLPHRVVASTTKSINLTIVAERT